MGLLKQRNIPGNYIAGILLLLFGIALPAYSQWEKVNIPAPFSGKYYLDVYFLESDPRYGWSCGYDGAVIRTTDGGNTWRGIFIQDAYQLESISFASPLIGYTSGISSLGDGSIYKTTDGGATWRDVTPASNSGNLWGNFFITPSIGLLVGGGCGASPQNFYRTTDGGASWTDFRAFEPNTGLCDVVLYEADGLGYASSSGKVWRTLDGGRTWNVYATSGAADWQEELTNIGRTFLMPFSESCTGGGPGGMRSSNDNGLTWREFRTGEAMFGAFLNDSLKGWVCGHAAAVYYTSDGGRSWELMNCGLDGNDMDDMWFINDTLGFVVGKGVYKYKPIEMLKPEITASKNKLLCPGDSIMLTTNEAYPHYKWSTGDTTRSIVVKKAGVYTVNVYIDSCSRGRNSFQVYEREYPQVKIIPVGGKPACEGDTLDLAYQPDTLVVVQWSNGSTTPTIRVSSAEEVYLTVRDQFNCTWTASFKPEFLPNPRPSLTSEGIGNFCVGDSTKLVATPGYSEYNWYNAEGESFLGAGSNIYYASNSGSYYVRTKNANGCENVSDTLKIQARADTNQFIFSIAPGEKEFSLDSVRYPDIFCKSLIIKNVSWKEAVLDRLVLVHNIAFSFPQSQFPIVIPAFDSVRIQLCYTPTRIGIQRDTVILPDICYYQRLPVRAVGMERVFESGTRCSVPILLSSFGKFISEFKLSDPFPNPAQDVLAIPVEYMSSIGMGQEINVTVSNSMGVNFTPPVSVNFLHEPAGQDTVRHNGNILIDLRGLNTGAYFAVITAWGRSFVLPFLIGQ